MAQLDGGAHPDPGAAGDEAAVPPVPTKEPHPADVAENAARLAVEGVGLADQDGQPIAGA